VPAYSVHDLYKIGLSKKYLGELLAEGVLDIADVPEDDRLKPKKPAKAKTKQAKELIKLEYINPSSRMSTLMVSRENWIRCQFPLYFLDYETYPTPIPPFDWYHPYQHIVFPVFSAYFER